MVRRATGGNPVGATGSFQERLDSILNLDPEPQRTLVANQDAEIRQDILDARLAEEKETLKKATPTTPPAGNSLADNQTGRIKPDLQETKILADEKTFLELQQNEAKEKKTKPAEDNDDETGQPLESKDAEGGESNIAPSLANNPFYFGPQTEKTFDDDKPIIISRLVQRLNYTELEAKNIVGTAASPEELVLFLMQKEEFEYGDAVEIVKTS
jgi:hypothetical protein